MCLNAHCSILYSIQESHGGSLCTDTLGCAASLCRARLLWSVNSRHNVHTKVSLLWLQLMFNDLKNNGIKTV